MRRRQPTRTTRSSTHYVTTERESSCSQETAASEKLTPRFGQSAPTGPNVARVFARLLPPGASVDVGPADIFDAYRALADGKSIDLQGAIGRLDFVGDSGEAPVDMAIPCVKRRPRAFDTLASGLVYRGATKKLVGAMRCP